MRYFTQQIVRYVGKSLIPFFVNGNTGTLQVPCKHTPDIPSSIFSPAETCERLDYDAYTITCNRRTHLANVTSNRPNKPSITLDGAFRNSLLFISLHSVGSRTRDRAKAEPGLVKKIADPAIFNQSSGKSVSYAHVARLGQTKHLKSRSLLHLTHEGYSSKTVGFT
jgi:hypothetical protein